MLKGKALNVMSQFDQAALDALSKAVKLDPKLVDAWNHLGECYWKNKDIESARNCFVGALNHVRIKCCYVIHWSCPDSIKWMVFYQFYDLLYIRPHQKDTCMCLLLDKLMLGSQTLFFKNKCSRETLYFLPILSFFDFTFLWVCKIGYELFLT